MLELAITITGGGALGATRGLSSLGARHYGSGSQVRGGRDVNLTNTSIDSCRVSSCYQEGGRLRRCLLLATGVQTVLQTSARECAPTHRPLHTHPSIHTRCNRKLRARRRALGASRGAALALLHRHQPAHLDIQCNRLALPALRARRCVRRDVDTDSFKTRGIKRQAAPATRLSRVN